MPDNMTPYPGPSGWQSASDWYRAAPARPAPAAPPAGPAAKAPRSTPRQGRRAVKIVTLCLCGALLCVAAALAVMRGGLMRRVYDMSASRAYWFDDGFGYDPDGGSSEEGALPGDGAGDYREYFSSYYTGSNEIDLPSAPTGTGVKLQLHARAGTELPLQEIYGRVSPAVVGINTYVDGEDYSWGTGVIFDGEAGYIVTNTHILQGCNGASVVLADGRALDARLVGADEGSDIAVLQVEGEELPAAEFGRSASLQVGDQVAAIGNPLGQDYTGTMTNGIISAIDRNVTYEGHTMTLLQTNAALNEGNSGGPLINAEGQVIGITNMKIMSSYFTTVEGIGFAIPSAVVKEVADQLIESGIVPGIPTIGIVAGPVGEDAVARFDLPNGIYVTEVSPGSDALEKGLAVGDVITAVNGRSVSSVADVNEIKDGMQVGDSITLTVYRDGETFELDVKLVDKGDIQ